MGGLTYLLRVNSRVKIYAPKEGFGVYGADLPGTFYRRDASLPLEQRYYGEHRRKSCDSGQRGPPRTFSSLITALNSCPVFT
jgi:7,8-dihydropterin-6-yl-methyl-4-(beta-D-ribofuranosyl)aminobenzene 5'-phosphate synthase